MKLKIGNATIEHMRKHENCKGLKDSSTGVLIVAPISTLEDCNKSIYNIEIWLYNTNNQTNFSCLTFTIDELWQTFSPSRSLFAQQYVLIGMRFTLQN